VFLHMYALGVFWRRLTPGRPVQLTLQFAAKAVAADSRGVLCHAILLYAMCGGMHGGMRFAMRVWVNLAIHMGRL
jgi:hypothetical protein